MKIRRMFSMDESTSKKLDMIADRYNLPASRVLSIFIDENFVELLKVIHDKEELENIRKEVGDNGGHISLTYLPSRDL